MNSVSRIFQILEDCRIVDSELRYQLKMDASFIGTCYQNNDMILPLLEGCYSVIYILNCAVDLLRNGIFMMH